MPYFALLYSCLDQFNRVIKSKSLSLLTFEINALYRAEKRKTPKDGQRWNKAKCYIEHNPIQYQYVAYASKVREQYDENYKELFHWQFLKTARTIFLKCRRLPKQWNYKVAVPSTNSIWHCLTRKNLKINISLVRLSFFFLNTCSF